MDEHEGIGTDLRETVARFEVVDALQGQWFDTAVDKVRDHLDGS